MLPHYLDGLRLSQRAFGADTWPLKGGLDVLPPSNYVPDQIRQTAPDATDCVGVGRQPSPASNVSTSAFYSRGRTLPSGPRRASSDDGGARQCSALNGRRSAWRRRDPWAIAEGGFQGSSRSPARRSGLDDLATLRPALAPFEEDLPAQDMEGMDAFEVMMARRVALFERSVEP
jgi:hypothetical protein